MDEPHGYRIIFAMARAVTLSLPTMKATKPLPHSEFNFK